MPTPGSDAIGTVEPRRADNGADRVARERQLVERVDAEQPRAVHRVADLRVLLEQDSRVAGAGERARGNQPCRPAADHDRIPLR